MANKKASAISRTIGSAGLLALVPSWLGLFGGWHWLPDLFAHFRWQYLIASLLVLAVALWRRHRKVAALAALTVLLNAALIGQLAWQGELRRAAIEADFSLRVLSLNVLTSNLDTSAALDHLLASGTDVIFLMEVDQRWVDALAPLQATYPHRLEHPRDDNFGVALYSRVPLEKVDLLWLGEAGLPSVEATLKHQGRFLKLIGTHTLPPIGGAHSRSRDRQLALLAEHVSRLQEPVLVVGDLNATPWSAGMRAARERGLDFRSLQPPWTPTWRARSIFAIPIDHALATAPLVITRRSIGPDVGSDHRPLELSVGWAK